MTTEKEENTAMSKNKKQARDEHKNAKAELERVSKRDRAETDAYLKANKRVAETEKHVPWWRR